MKLWADPIPESVMRLRSEQDYPARRLLDKQVEHEIMALRRMLGMAHGITYGDDGELQSAPEGYAHPSAIDFARDTWQEIDEKLGQRSIAKMIEWAKANPDEAKRLGFKFPEPLTVNSCPPERG